jgi:glycosyltransferase involved in cell wall biosynthesis
VNTDRSFDVGAAGAAGTAVAPATAATPLAAGSPAGRVAGAARRPLRVGFVMEQVLGHVTWYQNLRRGVEAIGEIEARWIETSMFDPRGLLERTPGVPDFVRASARARIDMRRGLRDWPCDVLFFNTQKAAAFCQWEMLRTPTMLMTDVTPVQYDRMAAGYDHSVDGNPLVRAAKHQANVVNFRLARALLPWSTWVGDSFVEDYGVPRERIHVVPVGMDVEAWQPPPARPTGERIQVLFVGGHLARKGGDLLLDVFREGRLHEVADLHLVTRDEAVQPGPGVFVHRNMQNNSDALRRLYQ